MEEEEEDEEEDEEGIAFPELQPASGWMQLKTESEWLRVVP